MPRLGNSAAGLTALLPSRVRALIPLLRAAREIFPNLSLDGDECWLKFSPMPTALWCRLSPIVIGRGNGLKLDCSNVRSGCQTVWIC